jgi:glycosyltransferase involved in cell wall biosynthesis
MSGSNQVPPSHSIERVSIYFPAGDFVDVLRRHDEGRPQVYQTHSEVALLIHDLIATGRQVSVYSFVSAERCEQRAIDGCRVTSLGAKDFSAKSLLEEAVTKDDADAVIAHFASPELLRALAATEARVLVMLAVSYNRMGIRSALGRWRIVRLLNNPRFELISNHCMPATEHLAKLGVRREKLIAWDIRHPFDPGSCRPKELAVRGQFEAFYAGSIVEDKGVPELIKALASLRQQGIEVHCSLAGAGDIEGMSALGAKVGVSDLLSFLRLIPNSEVFNRMLAADLVVVPSRTQYPEGFPLTMFEAIASRTPIVCSSHPMFRDVLVDGRNASVFAAGDYQALAAAIRRIVTDPVLYAALSANAPLTWKALAGPADWRTLVSKWIVEGPSSSWIRERMLTAVKGAQVGT